MFYRAQLNGVKCNFALSSAAVHFFWLTAPLYEEEISIGVIAVTQPCCGPVLQSQTEKWGKHFALTTAAVHFCWLTAHMYEEQISIGVIAVTRACREPVLQKLKTEQN